MSIKFIPSDVKSLKTELSNLLDRSTPAARNESVAIADNLLKRKRISEAEYTRINNYLAMHHCNQCSKTFTRKFALKRHQENNSCTKKRKMEERGEGLDAEEGAEKVAEKVVDPVEEKANKITECVEYLIRHDRKEIKELLGQFQDYDGVYEDDIVRLGQLVESWIEKQVATEKQIPLDDIKLVLWKLESSDIPRSKLIRLEMLLKDIFFNRYRVTDIVNRMDLVLSHINVNSKDVSDALKRMIKERLITDDQHDALMKQDDLNLDKVISEIKTTKVGRGLSFLPRETPDLLEKLKEWVMEFAKEGTDALRQKILSVLDELLFRKVITKQEHKNMKV